MCGIAAVIRPAGVPGDDLRRMAQALKHRGPDGQGYLFFEPATGIRAVHHAAPDAPRAGDQVGFAHRRLSILDLSAQADQPMVDETGSYGLIYNGELYNFVELRSELESRGHVFRSSGDTEVLLRAYIEWGSGCVERFVGMWTALILDLDRRVLFVTRDRFGVKPLYYALADGGLWFASEIKALLEVRAIPREVDEATLATYLVDGLVDHSAATFFRGVRQVPPAHSATVPLDRPPVEPRFVRYWDIPEPQAEPCTKTAISGFRQRLAEAVMLHARSDVPVGTCLSGGIDSSGLVGIAEELRLAGAVPRYAHEAFGYVPEDEAVSEQRFMAEVVRRTQVRMHYVQVPRDRFVGLLPAIVRQQDEPFGSASIAAQWFVFERAREIGIKVMLDGQGADEVLAGYRPYNQIVAHMLIRHGQIIAYARFHRAHRSRFGEPPLRPREIAGTAGALLPAPVRRAVRAVAGPPTDSIPYWLNAGELPRESALRGDLQANGPRSLHELLKQQTEVMSLPALLRYEDRNSMAHSIEARVPYLDHRLVEFAFELEDTCKLHGATSKYILREALRGTIPESVRTRVDKIGFRADPGATGALAVLAETALLDAPTDLERRWIRTEQLPRLIAESERSVEAEFALWRVINAKLWMRSFWG